MMQAIQLADTGTDIVPFTTISQPTTASDELQHGNEGKQHCDQSGISRKKMNDLTDNVRA
jgi:hypothetical protein